MDRCKTMSHIWHEVKAALAKQIPNHSFRMWIEPLNIELVDPHRVRLTCPNHFFRKRVVENFSQTISSELQKLTGKPMQLDIEVAALDTLPRGPLNPPQQLPLPGVTVQPHYGRLLRGDFTFDQFVVGRNNDFAYSAALSLAAHNNTQQHVLYLLSGTGMGKSHLSQAIGHHILAESPKDRVYYMTAEDFTNEMVSSYKTNSVDAFKNKYHKDCDVLLLEDIHYLSGKDRTQIELAHTLDSLINHNKKIIFSSCYAPTEIPKLSDNLRSRLTSGLISNIDPPQYSMRVKILKKYADMNRWTVPKHVLDYLASELTLDVRQLKSGIMGVVAKASLLGQPIDLELAASIIKNMVQKKQGITIGNIIRLVCKYYNLSPKELTSRSRKRSVVRPRQIAIYLARKYTDQPLQAIGKSFNRYHATALHAIGTVEKGLQQGGPIQGHIEYLTQKLESGDY
jgi:chromosomal replication initiator protein